MTDFAARFARVAAALLIGCLLWGCDRKPEATPGSAPGAAPGSAQTAKPKAYGSNLERVDCTMIAGWAWDASQPNTPIKVDVYDGGTLLGTAVAGIARKDLVDANKGDGRHGFKFPIPPALKDGRPHTIKVTISGTTLQLANSPKTLVCPGASDGAGTAPGTGSGASNDAGNDGDRDGERRSDPAPAPRTGPS
jgi:hypothetical protein